MSTKELQKVISDNMELWMRVENASIGSTGRIIEKTDHPVLRMVMEIIQRDSLAHYRTQEFIKRTVEEESVTMTPEDMASVWDLIEKHIQIEKRTIEIAKEVLEHLKGKKMLVQEYLLNYLLKDEQKHDELLEELSRIKQGMYPYG